MWMAEVDRAESVETRSESKVILVTLICFRPRASNALEDLLIKRMRVLQNVIRSGPLTITVAQFDIGDTAQCTKPLKTPTLFRLAWWDTKKKTTILMVQYYDSYPLRPVAPTPSHLQPKHRPTEDYALIHAPAPAGGVDLSTAGHIHLPVHLELQILIIERGGGVGWGRKPPLTLQPTMSLAPKPSEGLFPALDCFVAFVPAAGIHEPR